MRLEHALWDAARVALVLGLALGAMPLLRHAPAATRRLLLALALAGALVMPLASALAPAWRITAAPTSAAPRGVPELEPLAEGVPSPAVTTTRGAALATVRRAQPRSWRGVDAAAAFGVVWALGALLFAARLAVGIVRGRAMVRRAAPASSWARAVAEAERTTGLRADVRTTLDLDAPAVTGVLSPVVLVPESSATWTDARRSAVLLHELAHVRRHDCLVQILAQLACAAHWFDPLAWLAARRLRLERELAADDAVITAGARASSYAEDLLAIATAHAAPSAALGMAERSQLAKRIVAVVSSERARHPLSRGRAALLVAGSAALLGAVACAAPGAPPPAAPAPVAVASPGAAVAPSPASAPSTIDPRLQQIADEELGRTMTEWQAATGAIVVLDPATGEILASAGRAGGAPADVAAQQAYLTGSTLKAIVLAAALDDGKVAPGDRFDCENGARAYGTRILHDGTGYGVLTVPEMLSVSTNVGFSKIFDRLGGDRLDHWLRRFHFGVAPLGGAVAGEMPARAADGSFEGAVVAIGEAMTASPLQVAAAYAALANGGVYVAPTLSRRAGPAPGEPLVRPETAHTVVTMLEEAVNGERATGKAARIAGVRVAGKTGSAEWPRPGAGNGIYTSFVGIVPVEHPRFVVVVGVEAPRAGGYGGTVAAPAFARVVSRALGG